MTFADEVDIKRAVQHATIDFDRGAIDHACVKFLWMFDHHLML